MQKGLTELVFLLDRSGSMRGLEADTIGGYNSMLEHQKKEEGNALVTTIFFDDRSEVIHDRTCLADTKPITEKEYYVRGCTALLDALGNAVRHIKNIHKYGREEDRPEKTMFVIITDGMENSSRQYSYEDVRTMVERQQEAGWEFLFVGANMDAIGEAARIGIRANRAVNYMHDARGTEVSYRALDKAVSNYRGQKTERDDGIEEALWEVEADYSARKKS